MRKAAWFGIAMVATAGVGVAWVVDTAIRWADRHTGSTAR